MVREAGVSDGAAAALLSAVTSMHEAPDDASVWDHAITALTRAIPCDQAALIERVGPEFSPGFGLVVGTNSHFLSEYRNEYHRIDPFAGEHVVAHLHQLGRAVLSSEIMNDAVLLQSLYYREFLDRYGNLFHAVGGSFPLGSESRAQVWLMRPRGRSFDESERHRMDIFLSHARAALRQRRWMAQVERERDAALAWMDCWSDPMFVLDANGKVIISNLEAERLLQSGALVALQSGHLRPARFTDPDWISSGISSVLQGPLTTLCTPLLRATPRASLNAVMTLLPAGQGRASGASPQIALILRNSQHSMPHFEPGQLKDLFGFTAAETRVANALLSGLSVEEIARIGQVRRDTVRAHVKRLLLKTGTRKQGELQKFLVKSVPNLRALRKQLPDAATMQTPTAD